MIGSHHTLNIIVINKTYASTKSIHRTYCLVYPLAFDFKAFSLSISLSQVGTKGNKERIRLLALLVSVYFYFRLLKASLKVMKLKRLVILKYFFTFSKNRKTLSLLLVMTLLLYV